MTYKFFDSICFAGRKTVPSINIDSSLDSVKMMLKSVNIEKALFCPFESTENGSIYYNTAVFEKWENDGYFVPAFHLIPNPGESLDGPAYFEKFVKKNNPAIIYIFPNMYGHSINLENVSDYFDTADKFNIPVRIPSDSVSDKELSLIASEYKSIPFIISDMGFSSNINLPLMMKNHKNILTDTTFFPAFGIENLVNIFGSERIVFASKAPELSPAAPAGRIIMSGLKDEDKENIAYKNLERLTGRKM